jgi:hypothetical protein
MISLTAGKAWITMFPSPLSAKESTMKPSSIGLAALFFAGASILSAQEAKPRLIEQPDAFKTLVNPTCSHCRDEAKRRADDLKPDDRVLCWIRGYSEGGVIPFRFLLNPYRVISDTYGVFVYDPDAGYARGFAPSLDFKFHGWRNGVMVMKHKDGTLYSCLTGAAFHGPKKGDKLKAVPTLVSDWGYWLKTYPQAVAYQLFDKYQPMELPTRPQTGSIKSRGPVDKRMAEDAQVFGVVAGELARAYSIETIAKQGMLQDEIDGKACVILWQDTTKTAAAFCPVASPPKKLKAAPRNLTLDRDTKITNAPFRDKETSSRWDITGRAVDGELKGWTLEWLDGVQVKWFAWAAEHSNTTIYDPKKQGADKPNVKDAINEITGTAEFLRAVPKKFGSLQKVDVAKHQVTVIFEGDKAATTWTLTPDAEVKVWAWWGRLEDLARGIELDRPRVWAWFKVDRAKKPVAIFMLADDLSEQDIHGDGLTVKSIDDKKIVFTFAKDKTREVARGECLFRRNDKSADLKELKPMDRVFLCQMRGGDHPFDLIDRASFEVMRTAQKNLLREQWLKKGLPGTVGFLHLYSGEVDVLLDHEAIRWGRSLQPGSKVALVVTPPINAVVKSVTAQREKTQLRLVVKSFDLAELTTGQRVQLKMPAPSADVENDPAPPGIDLPKTKEERINWFLANIYCTCTIGGDGCTGHFYTLASCNPNGCGAPNATRQYLGRKIDEGWTNRQIFQMLLEQRGPQMLRPHLLP